MQKIQFANRYKNNSMKRKKIIILKQGEFYEAWGSLKEICEKHNLPYWTLTRLKFPIKYLDYEIIKVPFRKVSEKKIVFKPHSIPTKIKISDELYNLLL